MRQSFPKETRTSLLETRSKCEKCGSTKNLVVHHLMPQQNGGSDEKENAVVLCRSCHAKVHFAMGTNDCTTRHPKIKKYPAQINIAISDSLKATLDDLSESCGESISEIARRGLEREIAKLVAKQRQVGETQ